MHRLKNQWKKCISVAFDGLRDLSPEHRVGGLVEIQLVNIERKVTNVTTGVASVAAARYK